ncbi:MAG: hypothetical protein ACO1G9_15655 [Bacteroidota bacterium]
MNQQEKQLETLTEIRSLMERSSRFISLSGLSGIFAGIFALLGALAVALNFGFTFDSMYYYSKAELENGDPNVAFFIFFGIIAICMLVASLTVGYFFTSRKAKKNGMAVWDSSAKRLLINLFIPLVSGGLFCAILIYHELIPLVVPATLIFYGLALLNASKYTLNDIRFLGICEIILGLISAIFVKYGLLTWTIGFGLLHIIYGTAMYYKYER